MSEYDDVFGYIPEMNQVAARRQRAQERAAREEARRRAEAEEQERVYEETDQRSRQLATAAMQLLINQSVPSIPIISQRKNGYLNEHGSGWHVYSFDDLGDKSKKIEHVGVSDRGELVIADRLTASHEGVLRDGIISPRQEKDPTRRVEILESEVFRKGLASLIAGHGPYEYVQKPKPVDTDPGQPPLPGM